MTEEQADLLDSMAVMLDTLAGCIETQTLPAHGSPCHLVILDLLARAGHTTTRTVRPLPTPPDPSQTVPER